MKEDQTVHNRLKRLETTTGSMPPIVDGVMDHVRQMPTPIRRRFSSRRMAAMACTAAAACLAVAIGIRIGSDREPVNVPSTGGNQAAVQRQEGVDLFVSGKGQAKPALPPTGPTTAGPSRGGVAVAQSEIVLGPPGPGEVQLKRNLDGEQMNRRVPPDGWIGIGDGLLWRPNDQRKPPLPPLGGKYLEFVQDDLRVYVIVDEGPRELAGIRFRGVADMQSVRAAMKELSTPIILWCEAPLPKEFSSLPNLVWITDLQRVPTSQDLPVSQAYGVKFVDLSFLGGFTGLTSLDLSGCGQVCDLSPLAKLRNLEVLNLAGCNQVTDLSPLANLTRLESLNLAAWDLHSKLADLSPLAKLTNLRWLNLRLQVSVHDVSPLAQLEGLEWLNLDGCRIDDLVPLGRLTKLRSLSLKSSLTKIPDWSPLAKLSNLESLAIDGSPRSMHDISPLAELTKLRHLELSQLFGVSDLTPLAKLTNLTRLRMVRLIKISDLSALAKLTNLESFTMDGCDLVSDLSPLEELPKLKSLSVTGCDGLPDLRDVPTLREMIRGGADVRVEEGLR